MTAKSQADGWEIEFIEGDWWYVHNGKKVYKYDPIACKKCGTDAVMVKLCKPREHSGRTIVPVDACIAPIVQALNDAGIETLGSCCGHGIMSGDIRLADGRILTIIKEE